LFPAGAQRHKKPTVCVETGKNNHNCKKILTP